MTATEAFATWNFDVTLNPPDQVVQTDHFRIRPGDATAHVSCQGGQYDSVFVWLFHAHGDGAFPVGNARTIPCDQSDQVLHYHQLGGTTDSDDPGYYFAIKIASSVQGGVFVHVYGRIGEGNN